MEYYSEFIWERNDREVNEDSLAINQVVLGNRTLLMAVLCDGIGSLPEGEIAGSYVVSSMKTLFEGLRKDRNPRLSAIKNAIGRQLYSCHETLRERGIGTTVCMVVIYDRKALFIHAGDSRIYLRKEKFRQIGRDHTDEAGRLVRAIGVGQYRKMDYCIKRLGKKHSILICTDGFYKRIDKELKRGNCFLRHATEEERYAELRRMYETAKQRGEKDNSSAVYIWQENAVKMKERRKNDRKNNG